MSLAVKICGLSTPEAVDAAVAHGAGFVGFIFYPPSPRNVTPETAGALARHVPASVRKVGVFVDPGDELLEAVLGLVSLDMLQLHGGETPARVAAVKRRFGRPVMKAIPVAGAGDLETAGRFEDVADWLLFDAKPPRLAPGILPGGNGLSFDWALMAQRSASVPWMLSGGLDVGNLAAAARLSGAGTVDVSSGVESAPGRKDLAKIRAFLEQARDL
jgi:phosphoribosylanthranilate isomerase